ncbi:MULTISPECIES: hypothetical protein [Crocosphaera]|uniref:Uncharacterized protein n=4 Tax=Crocosphaera watsonii TaxID=263511 RepID=T2JLR3_CROWT|nr:MULTISPECIES: hypothetical protein [Crocosphaera]EHJ14437.1 hypothetical protein CWATWH0003_0905 [Crocosphaera watsonii WH 0003]MCH2245489.1 hypothetical protein [Crocosphaera sp.]NQZ63950.1 hypothetical protein [Crocosphaera sp.]CCQ49258.1 hypothetical protein CWATWH8502_2398 [Crocosphaera watsonii WH 8502]CCQ54550.1 hypothetical protein CWATWH0005_2596 [Crocosphaera watsonii WH 0005]
MNNIGINYESENFSSDYLPLISFQTEEQKNMAESYILTKAKIFFDKIICININVEKSHIKYSQVITDKDFRTIEINYFYDNILYDLGERNFNNQLDFHPKWGVTFDQKCAPIMMSYLPGGDDRKKHKNPKYRILNYSDRRYSDHLPFHRYGTINMNGRPIFYYIYFTLQEILNEIKK